MGVSAPIVVSMCSRYLSYDIGGGDWRKKLESEVQSFLRKRCPRKLRQ